MMSNLICISTPVASSVADNERKQEEPQGNNNINFEESTISAVRAALLECGLNVEVSDLFKFMRRAIEEGVQQVCFHQSCLRHFIIPGDLAEYNISCADMSFVSVNTLHGLYTKLDTINLGSLLRR